MSIPIDEKHAIRVILRGHLPDLFEGNDGERMFHKLVGMFYREDTDTILRQELEECFKRAESAIERYVPQKIVAHNTAIEALEKLEVRKRKQFEEVKGVLSEIRKGIDDPRQTPDKEELSRLVEKLLNSIEHLFPTYEEKGIFHGHAKELISMFKKTPTIIIEELIKRVDAYSSDFGLKSYELNDLLDRVIDFSQNMQTKFLNLDSNELDERGKDLKKEFLKQLGNTISTIEEHQRKPEKIHKNYEGDNFKDDTILQFEESVSNEEAESSQSNDQPQTEPEIKAREDEILKNITSIQDEAQKIVEERKKKREGLIELVYFLGLVRILSAVSFLSVHQIFFDLKNLRFQQESLVKIRDIGLAVGLARALTDRKSNDLTFGSEISYLKKDIMADIEIGVKLLSETSLEEDYEDEQVFQFISWGKSILIEITKNPQSKQKFFQKKIIRMIEKNISAEKTL